jgi:hypothetical protein
MSFAVRRPPSWTLSLAAAAAIGTFLALLGPFGSYLNGGLAQRFAYWLGALAFGFGVFAPALGLAERAPAAWRAAAIAAAFLAGGVVVAFATRALALAFWPFLARVTNPWTWQLQTLLLSAPICTGQVLLGRRLRARRPAGLPATARSVVFGPEVLCLAMEDHYVRVHTAQGSRLILMRFSDAIAATTSPGVQVHRSWWVALDAVRGVLRDGRNLRLLLANGLEVPVARRAVALARAAGLAIEPDAASPTRPRPACEPPSSLIVGDRRPARPRQLFGEAYRRAP